MTFHTEAINFTILQLADLIENMVGGVETHDYMTISFL